MRALRVRPRLAAAAALTAIAGAFVAVQPLGSPWWTGGDADSTYVASALRLFAGEPTRYFDHPGMPLQEAAAALFTASWAVDSSGRSRAEAARGWLWNLDSTRPYLRTLACLLFVAATLLAFLAVTAVFGHAGWGFLGGLLFLGSPDLVGAASIYRPDALVAGLSVATVGLAALAVARGSPGLFFAGAAVGGFALTVKLPAAGLIAPLVLGALLTRPPAGWGPRLRRTLGRRRAAIGAAVAVWLVVAILLNLGAAAPNGRYVRDLVAGLAAAGVGAVLAWLLLRRTPVRGQAALVLLGGVAYVAGALLPNFLFASSPPAMVRWIGNNLLGRDVTSSSHEPGLAGLHILRPWIPLLALALVGLARSLRARDWTALLWAAGAGATAGLALTQGRILRYWDAPIALLIPLALAAFRGLRPLWALPVVCAMLVVPFRDGIESADARGTNGRRVDALNRWVEARLRPGEVVLTHDESNDGRYFYLVRLFATGPPPPYRFLPADAGGAAYAREQGLRIRFLITLPDQTGAALLRSLGLPGRARVVPGKPRIYAVETSRRAKTIGAASTRTENAKK